jgi:phosphoribosyl-ATP pyrophosphohydrolase
MKLPKEQDYKDRPSSTSAPFGVTMGVSPGPFAEPPCFMFSLDDLARTIALRSEASAQKSYTRSLLEKGPRGAAKKFGEEAVELVIAAVGESDEALCAEAADVLYHLLVVLKARGILLDDVMSELERRTAQSGHAEKAARRS